MKNAVLMLVLVFSSLYVQGKPSVSSVADGYADWTGVEPKNRIMGRVLSASDFRQRVTIFVLLPCDSKDESGKKLGDFLRETSSIASLQSTPEWNFNWETEERLPRDVLVVAVLQEKCTWSLLAKAMAPRPGEDGQANPVGGWSSASFYSDVAMVNGPDSEGQYPYVYVMGPRGTEPRWKGFYKKGNWKDIATAVSKAKSEIGEWVPLTGISEPRYFTKERQELCSGKPAQGVIAKLKNCLTDNDAEKAKEAQIMYDAIFQHRSDLMFRIMQEYVTFPARAFVDVQRLVALFPSEKKNLQAVNARLKANKSVMQLGKMFEKVLEWSRPDFVFKNTSEAKKAVQLVNTWRKPLEKMANDQSNAGLAGEASLILSQLDGLAETLLTKAPQK